MKQLLSKRIVPLLLVLAMLMGFAVPANAAKPHTGTTSLEFSPTEDDVSMSRLEDPVDVEQLQQDPLYADTDIIRVSIFLEQPSLLEMGYSTIDLSTNDQAMIHRDGLMKEQAKVADRIEIALADKLDVVWNLTLAANLISANVPYGKIEAIANVPGVKAVIPETQYEPAVVQQEEADPTMIAATPMTGADYAWSVGYTGAGSRIAVIDTGLDTDHQSFDESAFLYSLAHQAGLKGEEAESYVAGLDLLDVDEIAAVQDKLNISIDPAQTFLSQKVPFAYNYVDVDYDVTHDNDTQGGHGSHVAGIATANAFIPKDDGTFANALTETHVQGVAPDAQILVMKVFGKNGGAFTSDYMAAIEDAIMLDCDTVNLSLGSANPGLSHSVGYEDFMEAWEACDTAVVMAAGNSGAWADKSSTGVPYLYAEDVNFDTVGSPGSWRYSMSVASANNNSQHVQYIQVGDTMVTYNQSSYSNAPIVTIAGDYEYVYIDGLGSVEEWAAVGDTLAGKVAVCSRGTLSFAEKANNAVAAGAVAVMIYNNQDGTINMDLTDYTYTAPVVSITQAHGAVMKQNAEAVTDDAGNILYYLGKLSIKAEPGIISTESEFVTMSSFSSWGVASDLILKPEVTTPGGSIYSVDGEVDGGKAYVTNSGTSMAAPHATGLTALIAQYIRENDLVAKTGQSPRHLINSLLMSTATPEIEEASGHYWSILKQGAGMANAPGAISAGTYILMGASATEFWADGKVKAELGHDPQRTGQYDFMFTVNNFSDVDKAYTLNADFFTQDILTIGEYDYLDTKTTPIAANVTYMVNEELYRPMGTLECDLNGDGVTDAADAQMILEYCAGNLETLDQKADVSGDGVISTYDAHMILNNMETQAFVVKPGETAYVEVRIELDENVKAWLDENYVNGAYLEGYVFTLPVTNEEGEMGVSHSIPVLGFYGDWNDASYFEKSNYWEKQYGTGKPNYTPEDPEVGAMFVSGKNTTKIPAKEANPYMIEDEVPYDRLAVRSDDQLYMIPLTTVRPSAAIAAVALDENGKVYRLFNVETQGIPAFYYVNSGQWTNTRIYKFLVTHFGSMGASEGEKVNFAFVAIPEMYLKTLEPTTEDIVGTIDSGILGKGCYQIYSMTIDNTAPELLDVNKSLMNGNLTITAKDEHYIASIQVLSSDGMTVYANVLPEATETGQTTVTTIDLTGCNIGEKCVIALGDYAGNETLYTVNYGGDEAGEVGALYAYTADASRDENSGWYKVDPDTLWYYNAFNQGGMEWQADCGLTIKAAEYVDGKVFVAADDGNFYVTDHGKWDEFSFVCNYSSVVNNIFDMAYNPQDGLFYITQGSASSLYTMNPATGEVAKGPKVEGTKPTGGAPIYRYARSIAIAPDGTFYITNWGSGTAKSYVYSFTLDQLATSYKVSPVGEGNALGVNTAQKPTLAWNETNQTLYLACNLKTEAEESQILYTVDLETGLAVNANTDPYYDIYAGILYVSTPALYTISDTAGMLSTVDVATGITLNYNELTVLKGAEVTLKASVTPWNLSNKALTWASSDNSVVRVGVDGTITALQTGTATITVTTVAEPKLTAQCVVTVKELPDVQLTAQITDSTGTWWADFTTTDPAGYTKLAESDRYIGGAMIDDAYFDDQLLVYNDQYNLMLGVDMDSFKVVADYGYLEDGWYWSDAAPCPTTKEGYFGGVATISHRGRYFMIEHPERSMEDYWVLYDPFLKDPMAMIAYVESSTFEGNPAIWYKVLTEGGNLYDLVYFTADRGTTYNVGLGYIGQTGIQLPSAGAAVGVSYGSMVYDAESGYLVAVVAPDKQESSIYMIDPVTAIATKAGSFGSDVWPVSTLTQYKRAADLEVVLNKTEGSMYIGDSTTLYAKVRPAACSDAKVIWTSSDETIATVSDNGVVTALKEGKVEIAATVTHPEDATKTAKSVCAIEIKPLTALDTMVSAQVETADGVYWMDIDLSDMSTTTVHTADVKYFGGGYSNGFVYGSVGDLENGGWHYATYIDRDYTSQRYFYGPFAAKNLIMDATNAPAVTFTYSNTEYTLFGTPVYTAADTIGVCKNPDPIGNNSSASRILDFNSAAGTNGAITFYDWYFTQARNSVPVYEFMVLADNGNLYKAKMTFDINDSFSGYYMGLSYSTVGNVGMQFKDYAALSMTTYRDNEKGINGLILSDSSYGKVSLYFIDMNAETLECAKIGDLEGAIDLAAMYNDFNKITVLADVPRNGPEKRPAAVSQPAVPATVNGMQIIAASTEPMEEEEPVQQPKNQENLTVAAGVVELEITDAEALTNGIFQVTYDETLLTFEGVTTGLSNTAIRNENGTLIFDFAAPWAVDAETVLATLRFTFDATCIDTEVAVSALQRNQENTVAEEPTTYAVVYDADGHTWEAKERLDPTCFADGYEVLVCSVCGNTVTNVLEANSDNCPCKNFEDLDCTKWYHEGLDFVLNNGLMKGTSETKFSPNGTLTRAQAVTVLYRAVGEPETDGANPFTDVAEGKWYTDAIIWAVDQGIVTGIDEDTFAPDLKITREQLATILFRFSGETAVEEDALAEFTDAAAVSGWAEEAMNWAVAKGLIQGVETGVLAPRGTATRAQFATILQRYFEG